MSKNYFADNSEQQAEHRTEAEAKPSYTRNGANIQKRIVLVHDQSNCNFENLSRIFVSHWLEKNTLTKIKLTPIMNRTNREFATFRTVLVAFDAFQISSLSYHNNTDWKRLIPKGASKSD
jgi:hypothetical protein